MKKVSSEEVERVGKRLVAQDDECIIIVNYNDDDVTQCMIHCHDKDEAMGLLIRFFQCNPELIPTAQIALGIAMESEEDFEGEEDEESVCMN